MADDEIAVLLVEDDPQDAQLTLRGLQSEDLAGGIEVARDGEEALDFLSAAEFIAAGRRSIPRSWSYWI